MESERLLHDLAGFPKGLSIDRSRNSQRALTESMRISSQLSLSKCRRKGQSPRRFEIDVIMPLRSLIVRPATAGGLYQLAWELMHCHASLVCNVVSLSKSNQTRTGDLISCFFSWCVLKSKCELRFDLSVLKSNCKLHFHGVRFKVKM